jgi:hypothetical protein
MDAKLSNKVTRPAKLSAVTEPSDASSEARSNDCVAAPGLESARRSRVNTRFHSVCELGGK